ncbi:MAG: 2,3-bisphosphoglycerate-dependent phosphoglycerate mutase [Actinomycetota bacterium]|nr:2,3-bisphosphoglycerate-dependent phosphoglycerate mutase [Actinomycetota bacterium]
MHDLLIIRHGESEWNVEKRWQGWLDAPLTARGLQQARDRADALRASGFAPAVVHCSDLGRARQTAEIIAETLRVRARPHPGLRERGGGDWEGSTADEIDERWPGMRDAWRRGELTAPPGGEDDAVVLARFDGAIASALDSGAPTLVVTHHGLLRLVAVRAGAAVHTLIPNLGGYWFARDNGMLVSPQPLDVIPSPDVQPPVE